MTYQIDQSGKIEQTERHSVIACTNGKKLSVLLKKSEKRILQDIFRETGNQKYFPYLTFSVLVAIIIKKAGTKNKIVIDREYFGHEELITEKIEVYLTQLGEIKVPPIEFGHVGKLTHAHNLAYAVARGKSEASLKIDAKEIMSIILGTKKIG